MNPVSFLYGNQTLELEETKDQLLKGIEENSQDPISVYSYVVDDFFKGERQKIKDLIADLRNTLETVSFFPATNVLVIKDLQSLPQRKSPVQTLKENLAKIRLAKIEEDQRSLWIDIDSLGKPQNPHQQISCDQLVRDIQPLEGSAFYLDLLPNWKERMVFIQKKDEKEAVQIEDWIKKKTKKNLFFKIPEEGSLRSGSTESGFVDILVNYIKSPPENCFFIFMANIKSLKEIKQPLSKLLQEKAKLFKTTISNDNFRPTNWVMERARLKDLDFDYDSASLLIEIAGSDLSVLNEELNKLSILLPKNSSVTSAKLMEIASHSKKFNIFTIADYLSSRDLKNATEYLEEMIGHQVVNPLPVFGTIGTMFRRLLKISWLNDDDKSEKEIVSTLKLNPYFGKIAIGQSKNFSTAELENIVIGLAELDLKIKYNTKDALFLLEIFCHRVCSGFYKKTKHIDRHWLPGF